MSAPETVWIAWGTYEDQDGDTQPRHFEVNVGSPEHERLLKSGGVPVDSDEPGDGLDGLKRGELDARAAAAGVPEPEKLPNKDAVIDAIRAAETG